MRIEQDHTTYTDTLLLGSTKDVVILGVETDYISDSEGNDFASISLNAAEVQQLAEFLNRWLNENR